MEMQLIRQEMRLEQPLRTARASAVVTGEVTLPGGLREETRVLAATAAAVAEQADVSQERVNVRGRVVFHILYTQGDPEKPQAIEASADFMQPLSVPGAQVQGRAEAAVQVQSVEARAVGGRLSLRADVNVDVKTWLMRPVEVIAGVEGSDDVETMTREATISLRAASGTADVLLREELALPAEMQIRDTLFASAVPVVEDVTGGVGRVGISGHVLMEAVHASALPGRPVVVTRHTIPFTRSVEVSGSQGETLDGSVSVRDVAVASQMDGDGMIMRAEVLLSLEAGVDEVRTQSVMLDAYTTSGDMLRLTGQELTCRTGSQRIHAAESGRVTLRLPEGAPPVRTVLAAFAEPVWEEFAGDGSRTLITGVMDVTLVYMTDGSAAPVSQHFREPFRVTFAEMLPPDSLVQLTAVEAEALPVTSDRVEVRCILRLDAACDTAESVALLTGGQVTEGNEPSCDLTLYYVQPGERLWDVARRYRVTVDSVRALNPDLRGEVTAGQGVLVWRRQQAAQA